METRPNPAVGFKLSALDPAFLLEPDYYCKEQLGAGYNIGLGLHGSESWPAFTLKSPGSEPIEFKLPTPNPFRPELSNPKPDAPNTFKPVPSNPKPRRPKAPKSSAKVGQGTESSKAGSQTEAILKVMVVKWAGRRAAGSARIATK